MADQLASRPLDVPHPSRITTDPFARDAILSAHRAARAAGEAGYTDPITGLFVFTAAHLAAEHSCCDSGCRHCPYIDT